MKYNPFAYIHSEKYILKLVTTLMANTKGEGNAGDPLNAMEVREDDEEFKNPVDLMFEALEKKKPGSFAGRQYRLFKLAAGPASWYFVLSKLIHNQEIS